MHLPNQRASMTSTTPAEPLWTCVMVCDVPTHVTGIAVCFLSYHCNTKSGSGHAAESKLVYLCTCINPLLAAGVILRRVQQNTGHQPRRLHEHHSVSTHCQEQHHVSPGCLCNLADLCCWHTCASSLCDGNSIRSCEVLCLDRLPWVLPRAPFVNAEAAAGSVRSICSHCLHCCQCW